MITITSGLSQRHFTSDVPDVSFAIDGTHATVCVALMSGQDATLVYDERLYPMNGIIMLRSLGLLLEGYIRQTLVRDVEIRITEYSGDEEVSSKTLGTSLVYCAADLGMPADEFCSTHFLTILNGERTTAYGRLEYLHYIGTDETKVRVYYSDGSTTDHTAAAVSGNDKYKTVDVSPHHFVDESKKGLALRYTVSAGERSQTYVLDRRCPDCAPILIFDNSFGCEELLYCTGTHTVAPSYTRNNVWIDHKLRNYKIEEQRKFKADTGILSFPMANWADELFRSDRVHLVNIYNGEPTVGKEVLITDSKSEYTNDDDTLPRFTFEYIYSQRIHNVIDLKRVGRIFDNTFDNTFE